MKKILHLLLILCCSSLLFTACKKELSYESGFSGPAEGTLTNSAGNCQDPTINGNYIKDTVLTDSNYVLMNVIFTKPGKYKIYTDTVNGMWFIDSGYVQTIGPTVVKVKGYGTPILPIAADFIVTMGSSFCGFTITTIDGASQGTSNDYFPTTTGSVWNYQFAPKLPSGEEFFTSTITGNTQIDNNLTYFEFETDYGAFAYYAKDANGNYYSMNTSSDFDYLTVFSDAPKTAVPYIFLKDNVPETTTWDSPEFPDVTYNSQKGKTKITFTITKKNLSYTVGGQTLLDVIKVKREMYFQATGASAYTKILEGYNYYAKGIGLVDEEIGNTPTPQHVQAQSWIIK